MKTYTFVLTEAQANIALQSMAKQPYEAVAETIAEMQRQAASQEASKKAEEP